MHGKGAALIAVWIYKTLIALCHEVLQIERAGFYFILFYGLPEADSKAMAKKSKCNTHCSPSQGKLSYKLRSRGISDTALEFL